MTHGQRAYAHDASDLTVETAIMATYNTSTLPKGVATGLATAAKAENDSQPNLSQVSVTLSGDITLTIHRGAADNKRTAAVDWQVIAIAAMTKCLPSVRAAIVRDALAGIASGQCTPDERLAVSAEAGEIIAAFNAAKPRVLLPGERTVRFGAVEVGIASSLPEMIAE